MAEALAERLRQEGRLPVQRPKLVIAIPYEVPPNAALDVAVLRAEPLGRADLEVAARYAAAEFEEGEILARLRMAVSVEMAASLLPSVAALARLKQWMAAPQPVFYEVRRFADFARDCGDDLVLPEFELWRAQHGVLLADYPF